MTLRSIGIASLLTVGMAAGAGALSAPIHVHASATRAHAAKCVYPPCNQSKKHKKQGGTVIPVAPNGGGKFKAGGGGMATQVVGGIAGSPSNGATGVPVSQSVSSLPATGGAQPGDGGHDGLGLLIGTALAALGLSLRKAVRRTP